MKRNRNNFDVVRLGLALTVVMAHISTLSAVPNLKVLNAIFDSNFAVKGFFAISGFLVTKSYLTSSGVLEYAEKRLRRIYPAYLTAVVFCLIVGCCVTSLSFYDFIKSSETLSYIASNALFLNFIQPTLPSVFANQPVKVMNGALWTIKVEVMLYFCVPFLVALFRKLGSIRTLIFIFILSTSWVYGCKYIFPGEGGAEIARQFPGQLAYFGIGSFFAVDDKWLAHTKWLALISFILLWIFTSPSVKLWLDPFAYSSIVIFLATDAFRSLNLGRYGDLSYGIYLFHFPLIQLLVYMNLFDLSGSFGLVSSLTLSLLMAWISWHLIEKPFLKRSSHYVTATCWTKS